ncbi:MULTISPECIES: DUF4345 domain-containing protein [Pseudomonas]|jgi:hypothetical protein|uniref:Uncharacterized protein n=2 Tax=Ectopseudomonas TaxID=3236654 RepID=A0A653B6Y2_ECTOL|nr:MULTISPECIES: DUF4345 domain-containing protein [Pseudomonas]TNF06752.1 MAG: DUF4345 domain-containing protein [Pseudomonadales bacterium]CAE6896125.1 conserved membrane protein of unknown function [Pseudomonas oleovorans]HIQ42675.1 DUF4345 domain-containing protein [Pseudomonas oleovorans]|tara:strand:- start:3594 stop:3983 length:390 start_codon:yes stop_codon:yes gene_type:complete
MLFARIVLLIQIAALVLLGLAYFIRPEEMASFSGALLMSAAAVTEVRAFYGGLQLGLAAFLAMALLRLDLLRPALTLLVLLYSALAVARIGGLWLDGGAQQTFNLYALLLELVSAGLAWWALRGIQRGN